MYVRAEENNGTKYDRSLVREDRSFYNERNCTTAGFISEDGG